MLFNTAKNWKEFLSPRDEERLNMILNQIARHRGAYKNSDEIKIAQIWCAILETKKENALLYKKVRRLEMVLEAALQRISDEEKEKRDIIENLEGF
ncbi:MAG: hypothetical protein HZB66_01140 [Candidatus Aenigmarchaeota archaeon]|nr:hypothetical protein [Candidatus Aenigmarchaeota archaeon]